MKNYIFTLSFTFAYILLIAIQIFSTRFISGSRESIAASLGKIIKLHLVAVLSTLILLYTKSYATAFAITTIYMLSMVWAMCFTYAFLEEYTGIEPYKGTMRRLVFNATVFDTILLLLNIPYRHVLDARIVQLGGRLFYAIERLDLYRVHGIINYVVAVVDLILVLIAIRKSIAFYRIKFIMVLVGMLLAAATYIVYSISDTVTDFSVIGYSVFGIIITIGSLGVVPWALMRKTFAKVIHDMDDAVVIHDRDGKLVFANSAAEKHIKLYTKTVNTIVPVTEKGDLAVAVKDDFSIKKETSDEEGNKITISIEYKRLLDEENGFLGSYIMVKDISAEEESLRRERYEATHDRLTDLYNASYFYKQLEALLTVDLDTPRVLICTNIDDFKIINDVFGADTGDDVLRQMADMIRSIASDDSVFGRNGADRFALAMKKSDFNEDKILEKVRGGISIKSNQDYPVNIKLGVYNITDRKLPIPMMCDRAFMAVSSIKGDFQKTIAYYDENLRNIRIREMKLSGDLNSALEKKEFLIYLQPQMNGRGVLQGAEALVRWKHIEDGEEKFIFPGEFIEVYERNGLIALLDAYIWEEACIVLDRWNRMGRNDLYISINISPKDFYFLDIKEKLESLVAKYSIPKKMLKLEITETALMSNVQRQLSLIENLRKSGFIVEMDDFGSGYSSLTMLKSMHVDVIKLDMGFLRGEGDEDRTLKILKMVVQLTRDLKTQVIAEGVETREQVDYLVSVGCDVFQGYYFAKPMPVEDFERSFM